MMPNPNAVHAGRYAGLLGSAMSLVVATCTVSAGAAMTAPRSDAYVAQPASRNLEPLRRGGHPLRDRISRALAEMTLAADAGRVDRARAALARYRATHDRDGRRELLAWTIASNADFASGAYGIAAADADHWRHWLATNGSREGQTDADNLRSIALSLAPLPAQRLLVRRPRVIAVTRDQAGLLRAAAQVNGKEISVVLDTGANVSTISLSAARRLGVHVFGRASVGSGTRDAISARVGFAPTLDIAGIRVANVAFLVLNDDQLTLPIAGYRLDVILGFPVFRQLQRVRFTLGSFEPFAGKRVGARVTRMHFDGSSLFVDSLINGRPARLQLDSGAPASSLTSTFVARNPDILNGLSRRSGRTASAGGTSETREAILPHPVITIGHCTAALPDIPISLEPVRGEGNDGVLGQDAIGQLDAYTLNFSNASISLEGRTC